MPDQLEVHTAHVTTELAAEATKNLAEFPRVRRQRSLEVGGEKSAGIVRIAGVADRDAGDRSLEAYPDLVLAVRANRAFLARAVRFLVHMFNLCVSTGYSSAPRCSVSIAYLARPRKSSWRSRRYCARTSTPSSRSRVLRPRNARRQCRSRYFSNCSEMPCFGPRRSPALLRPSGGRWRTR
jgi:hypothetical protein